LNCEHICTFFWQGAQLGGLPGRSSPRPNQNLNNTDFVGMMISNNVRGLPLSLNPGQ